ncbi:MAG: hypothetical protein IKV67_10450, partial [Paludibacteraceae bacterium]|nr:hypothetical protein [Paludibacteraceae bacterium]
LLQQSTDLHPSLPALSMGHIDSVQFSFFDFFYIFLFVFVQNFSRLQNYKYQSKSTNITRKNGYICSRFHPKGI